MYELPVYSLRLVQILKQRYKRSLDGVAPICSLDITLRETLGLIQISAHCGVLYCPELLAVLWRLRVQFAFLAVCFGVNIYGSAIH